MKTSHITKSFAMGAAIAIGLSAAARAVDINGGTSWNGWINHGSSTNTGLYARNGKANDYQIYSTVFI